jgi:hypothetical protein
MRSKLKATAAASRHMGRVAALGCIACIRLGHGETPCQVHHIREGRIERNDFLTIGLCKEHHTGSHRSVHNAKPELLRALKIGSEFDLLADVLRRLAS